MTWRSKFVPVALAITLLALPVIALSACWIPMTPKQEMAMVMNGSKMVASAPLVNVQLGTLGLSCCQIYAAGIPPAVVSRTSKDERASAALASRRMAVYVPPAIVAAESPNTQLRSSPHQAVLCVFLI
jgi:hypothetical protein